MKKKRKKKIKKYKNLEEKKLSNLIMKVCIRWWNKSIVKELVPISKSSVWNTD